MLEYHTVNDGIRLAVEVTGEPGARPLVLLHGGGNDRSSWAGVAPAFTPTHRVYSVDLRGFGDTDRTGKYSFEAMRDDVLGLLDAIGADGVDLIGHSMGGTVAWLVAEARPNTIAHLVIEDTPIPRPGARPVAIPDRPDGDLPYDWDALVAVLSQLNAPDPAWWTGAAAITAPTLVLAGGPASHVDQQLFGAIRDVLPAARVVAIPVGHRIHAEAPDAFLAQVVPFLTGQG